MNRKTKAIACLWLLIPVALIAGVILRVDEPGPRANYAQQMVTLEADSTGPIGIHAVTIWVFDIKKGAWLAPIHTQMEDLPTTIWHRYTIDLPSPAWVVAQSGEDVTWLYYERPQQ
jgi:hypothetical protein